MKYMFYKCKKLEYINLLSFDIKNVRDISYMFASCYNLNNLDLTSFNINLLASPSAGAPALKYGDVNTETTSPDEVKGLIILKI